MSQSGTLDEILAQKKHAHTLRDPLADWDTRVNLATLPKARSLAEAIRTAPKRPAVIAEFKRRSPSLGTIREGGDAGAAARAYREAGAAAVSVLTEGPHFGGHLDDLGAAKLASTCPILRKDFLLFEEDLLDARMAGADAVLLIARILDGQRLPTMITRAREEGLESLVEVHSEAEWERALGAGATLVGVNHRDLSTLAVDLELSARIGKARPEGVLLVAESGLSSAADLVRMRDRGYDAVLVGAALMQAADEAAAGAALADLLRAL